MKALPFKDIEYFGVPGTLNLENHLGIGIISSIVQKKLRLREVTQGHTTGESAGSDSNPDLPDSKLALIPHLTR